jgi:hypothetical protein
MPAVGIKLFFSGRRQLFFPIPCYLFWECFVLPPVMPGTPGGIGRTGDSSRWSFGRGGENSLSANRPQTENPAAAGRAKGAPSSVQAATASTEDAL